MNDVSAPGIVRLSWLTTIRDSAAARSNVPGLDRVVLNYLDGFRCPVGQASWPVAGRKSRFAATTGRRPVPPKFTAGGPSPWRRSLQAGRLATPRRSRLKRRLRAELPGNFARPTTYADVRLKSPLHEQKNSRAAVDFRLFVRRTLRRCKDAISAVNLQ
jgi:hypothetical protein